MDTSEMVVLADGLGLDEARAAWEDTLIGVEEWPEDLGEGGRLLERLYDEGRQQLIVCGGDGLVGRVVTAYWRRSDLGAKPLRLWPLDVDDPLVAHQGDEAMGARRAARLVNRGIDTWQRRRVGTLKVSASTEKAAWYGFSFGAGWIYRAAEARKRARGGAGNFAAAFGRLATETLSEDDDSPVALRVAVDHRPRSDSGGSMVASTLSRTYFGFGAAGEEARLWDRLATKRLIRRAVTPTLFENSSRAGESFETIHLDTPQGWVLDGRLHGTDDSGVVQIMPGPSVTLTWPKTGLDAVISGVFGRN